MNKDQHMKEIYYKYAESWDNFEKPISHYDSKNQNIINIDYSKVDWPVTVSPNTRSQKGKIGTVKSYHRGNFIVLIDGKEYKFKYTELDLLDKNNNPIIENPKDITGREVKEGNIIAYSVSMGENSHSLEIGKITKLTPAGYASTERIIRNGEKIEKSYYYKSTKQVDTNRCILLPIDKETITMWCLSDFKMFKDND